jgi:shikimate kinase
VPARNESSPGGKMKKVILISAALMLAVTGTALADHHMKGEGGMKMMDANKDGMISKDEFMKHHEMMWDKMKKNPSGSVDMKDMEAMHKEMGAKKDMKH